jgi:DNA invertase Pin-like site-specific DNA recombinase
MKAILLVRVSTKFQDSDPQEQKLIDYANSMGYNDLHIIQTVESGLVESNSKLGTNELFQKLEADPSYKTVFCTELSRIGRIESFLHFVKEYLVKNKVQLIIPNQLTLLNEKGEINSQAEIYFTLFGFISK